jgi:hypothetical protein
VDWWTAVFVSLLGDEAAPTHPVWGLVNATLNALTLVVVAALYSRRR